MPEPNKSSSDLTKRIQSRTIYADYIVKKQKFEQGCSDRILLTSGSASDNASSFLIQIAEGTIFTTPSEQTIILERNTCPILSSPAPAPAPAPPTVVTYTWVEQTSSPSQVYSKLTVSSDFTIQMATRITSIDGSEGPYISTDSGATWTRRITGITFATGAYTNDVTLAKSNPSIMYIAQRRDFSGTITSTYDDIYKSTDGGLNWSVVSPAVATWFSITCSYDGTIILAGNSNGSGSYDRLMAISINGGTSWSPVGPIGQWRDVAMSSTGSRLYALNVNVANLYRSTDNGASWQTTSVVSSTRSVACSLDGLVVLVGTTTRPRLSIDGGVTVTEVTALPTSESWDAIAVSEDGTVLAAASSTTSRVWISRDTGANWSEQTTSPNINWQSMDMKGDGSLISGGPSSGKVQIGTYVP